MSSLHIIHDPRDKLQVQHEINEKLNLSVASLQIPDELTEYRQIEEAAQELAMLLLKNMFPDLP